MADGWLVLGLRASRSESVNVEYASFAALINAGRPEQIAVFPSVYRGIYIAYDTQKKTNTLHVYTFTSPKIFQKLLPFSCCCNLVNWCEFLPSVL